MAAAAAALAAAAAAADTKKKPKKLIKRIPLKVECKPSGLDARAMMDAQEAEGKMQLLDRVMRETADAMNALESKVSARST